MKVAIDEVFHFGGMTHAPTTGAITDADSTPTFEVFEEATDTDIGVGGNMTKRTSKTGNYRGSYTVSAANGFEAGKWYETVMSATVGSVAGKAIVAHFQCVAAESVAGVPKVDASHVGGTAQTAGDLKASLNTIDDFVDSEIADIQARLPAALTAGGNMKADALAISGSTESSDRLERSTLAIVTGTMDAGSTTTSLVAASTSPASGVNDQFNGRIIIFDKDTTTAALRGQATDITDYVHATLTFTVTALTTAPASGDTFTVT